MPSANTSLRRSTGSPLHCSGDMYATLPLSMPACVSLGAMRGLRDAEVDDLHVAVVADEDVRRRHVAMDDAERLAVGAALLVRVVQPAAAPTHDRDDVLERHRASALADAATSSCAQVLAVDVLHREEVLAALLADVVDLDDVGVVQRGGEARLVEEHRARTRGRRARSA